MTDHLPFGADTLIIPFTRTAAPRRRHTRMSRMRPAGELFRNGLARTFDEQAGTPLEPVGRPPKTTVADVAERGNVGTFVTLPDGTLPVDSGGNPLHIPSPVSDLRPVAAAGRAAGEELAIALPPDDSMAQALFLTRVGQDLATGGRFDFQRSGGQIDGLLHGFEFHKEFVNVSNVNVGLWLQQAGYSLHDTLKLAGTYAAHFSGQTARRTQYGLTTDQEDYITTGWKLGASVAYGPPAHLP